MRGSREGGWRSRPPQKPQVAKVVLRNTGMESLEKQLDPAGPIASRRGSVQPSVKYVDEQQNTTSGPPYELFCALPSSQHFFSHAVTFCSVEPEASSIMRALSGARCTDVRLYTL